MKRAPTFSGVRPALVLRAFWAFCASCAFWALCVASGGCEASSPCGPAQASVRRVLDGDTVELEDGELVRYLLVDTPELTRQDCFAAAAEQANSDLVLGKVVALEYDQQCRDSYGRLLAYVAVAGRDVNRLLVERGYARVLHIPPNGADRVDELRAVEADARIHRRGMWGTCSRTRC
jgi:micrococcal nuclease